MDHLIGQRFSLISKSEIRYVGILHEINPEQSTIALEEVFSFGTEDRPVENYIPPSQQKFEYIVFRGSDVKDIKIEEESKEPKQPQQPPNDPAILNSSRPGPAQQPSGPPTGPPSTRGESPFPPQNFPPPGYGGYYGPPPPGQFGRGYGPPPGNFGPGPGYPPYGPPPPPGYFGPPGQGFPHGPNRFPPQNPPPIGPPGQRQPPPPQQQQPPEPSPAGPAAPAPVPLTKQTPELPVEKTTSRGGSKTSTPAPTAPPAQAIPPAPKAADVPQPSTMPVQAPAAVKAAPTQPRSNRIAPAMPFAVNQKSFTPPLPSSTPQSTAQQPTNKPAKSQAEMEEASRQAKEAVANALAKLNPQSDSKPPPPSQTTTTIETITEKVSQITTGPPVQRGRGNYRGSRGARTSSGGHRSKLEIPQSDFDFESANAKFNKEDLIKEAIASGSPVNETSEDPLSASGIDGQLNGNAGPARKDSFPQNPVPAYNKASSFFDNISSEAKDREDVIGGGFNARTQRGAEFKKNVETFGQGNVDSGYRGRGRGGYRGRGRGGDYNNRGGNYRGAYRGRGRGPSGPAGEENTVSQH